MKKRNGTGRRESTCLHIKERKRCDRKGMKLGREKKKTREGKENGPIYAEIGQEELICSYTKKKERNKWNGNKENGATKVHARSWSRNKSLSLFLRNNFAE